MRRFLFGIVIASLVMTNRPGQAQVFKTQDVALEQAFPGHTEIQRKVVFLTERQVDAIQKLAKAKVESKVATYYKGVKDDSTMGFAFFETNIVRTKPETFMTVLRPDGSINYVEILAFYEPLDYLPTQKWLGLFMGRILNADLWPKQGIYNITGATLSVQAVTLGVRKILATYKLAISKGELN